MKRVLFAILLVMMVAGAGLAQKAYLGPRVSAPLGWATGGDWDDLVDTLDDAEKSSDFGILLGLEFTYYFSERFSAEVAALWGIYQWSFEGKPSGGEQTLYDCRLDWLEVPIVASYRIPVGRGAITMGGGPLLIFPTGKLDIGADREPPPPLPEEAGEDLDKTFVVGATAGLGYDYPIGRRGILSIDARYVRNITKFFDEDEEREYLGDDFDEFYINAVAFYVSYGFAIGGRR